MNYYKNRKENATYALEAALSLRRSLGYGLWDAIPIYDCAQQMDIEVRFMDIPSLEAIYAKGSPPTILISSLRPSGRQVFSCAHEIGHHVFKHGNRLDQISENYASRLSSEEEYIAQVFAGFFLMPRATVQSAFATRGWKLQTCTSVQVYTVSNWFGVGYETLIDHMQYGLGIIPTTHSDNLKQFNLRQIRQSLLNQDSNSNLIVVDENWKKRAIDIQVDDMVLLPKGTLNDGNKVQHLGESNGGELFVGICPGICKFYNPVSGWSAYVRVAKRGFIGRSIFRHLEDEE